MVLADPADVSAVLVEFQKLRRARAVGGSIRRTAVEDEHMSLRIDRDARYFTEIHVVRHFDEIHVPIERNGGRLRRQSRWRGAKHKQSDQSIFHVNPPESGRCVSQNRPQLKISIRPGPQNDNCGRRSARPIPRCRGPESRRFPRSAARQQPACLWNPAWAVTPLEKSPARYRHALSP